MTIGQVYFYFCALLALLGALAVALSKSPVRAAMGLLMMVLAIAGLFLALDAQFLAAIQLAVYAGAIGVLFLFVIMLLGQAPLEGLEEGSLGARVLAGTGFGALALAGMILTARATPAGNTAFPAVPAGFGSVGEVGRIMFTQTLLPFELSSALLMVAVVGAIAVSKGKRSSEANASAAEQKTGESA
jgi:NADH-quinone oxidoreductase subunit J